MTFLGHCFRVPILWRADEHFNEVVVQAVVNLMLQVPFELRMIQIASVDRKHIGVHGNVRVVQVDQDFDGSVVVARRKGEKRVLVAPEVIANFRQVGRVSHPNILLTGGDAGRSAEREDRLFEKAGKS